MSVKTGQVWTGLFVTKDATGLLATPGAGPAGALYVNGTVNAATVTITGSNPYKWSVTLPSLAAGDSVSMYITATIATIATAAVVAEASADTVIESDTYARIGAPTGASVSADIAGVQADTDNIQTRIPAALVSGRMDSYVGDMGADVLGETELADSAVAEIVAALSGGTCPTVEEIRQEMDANSTQLAAIVAKTNNLPSDPASESLLEAAISAVATDTTNILTRLPAALVGGRMDSYVGDMGADVLDADALVADAVAEIVAAIEGGNCPSADDIANAVINKLRCF